MFPKTKTKTENLILGVLPLEIYQKAAAHLKPVEMPLGQKIYAPGEKISHVYFPETSVISIVTYLENGDCVETGIIGKEGVSGTETVLNRDSSPREAMVQLEGVGSRMKVEKFRELFASEEIFRKIVLQYVYNFIAQISQNPACLCYHNVEKRLARWLLSFQDRAASDDLKLTQEFIAVMLGVHRPSVSKCAARLQEKGLINYKRGKVKILDRAGLLNVACECYEVIKEFSFSFEQEVS